ncbi:MAG: hypothetical protein DVB28_001473 [Verrucomicrobia bacterium]|nr:MAG: hypothetical protein DVB28_001473 [Verrucomicrobiota bacterium]
MATRNKDFPIVIKAGSSAVKIYKETKPNGEYYRVCYYAGGKRERLTFSSLEEAKTEARLKANLLSRGDSAALQLTGQDRLIYGRAIDAIRPFQVPLDAAAIEYAEARQILGSRSLLEAARFFQNYLQQGITGKPIPEAVAEFVEEKRSARYIKSGMRTLGSFFTIGNECWLTLQASITTLSSGNWESSQPINGML